MRSRSTVAGLGLVGDFWDPQSGSFLLTASRIRSLYIHDLGPHLVFGGAAFLDEMIEYKLKPPDLSSFHQFLLLVASDVLSLRNSVTVWCRLSRVVGTSCKIAVFPARNFTSAKN